MNDRPLAVEWIPLMLGERPGHRLVVILAAPGCAWAAATGGCTNCSFPRIFGTGVPVTAGEYAAQLEAALEDAPSEGRGPVRLELFVSGSYFNPDEVPPDAQTGMIARAEAAPFIERILVESRPEYVEPAVLERAVAAAGSKPLVVAVGLESANPEILGKRIRKGFGWRDFERAAERISAAGAQLLTYLLLKPLGTSEREAIEDAVASAKRVFELGDSLDLPVEIGLEPCFVGPGTEVERAFLEGRYRPPRLWSVVETIERIAPLGPVQVGLSDEGLDPAAVPRNCDVCTARVREALAAFNRTRDPAPLAALDCPCRAGWAAETGIAAGSRAPIRSAEGDETTR